MKVSILIPRTNIWAKSRRRVLEVLRHYHSENNPKIILNFGSRMLSSRNQIILNKDTTIMRDKIEMNMTLDKFGIRHPKTYYHPFSNIPFSDNECVIKERFGQRGNNIIFTRFSLLISNYMTTNHYIQHYIPFEREYRIGIDFKRILGIREKIGDSKIKNSKSCIYTTIKNNRGLEKFALKVFKKFKVDFCGIDIGECNGKYYVIEINSAPTVGEVWARKLANDLIQLLKEMR